MLELILLALVSYLIGAVPFSYIFPKFLSGVDVRHLGTRNVGATNALLSSKKKTPAILALIFDMAKGLGALFIANIFIGDESSKGVALFFAVVGHDFPFYLEFKGGKGIATEAGGIIGYSPATFFFLIPIYLISLSITKYVILSTIIVSLFMPIVFYLTGMGFVGLCVGSLFLILNIYTHREDLLRILSGKEKKISDSLKGV